MGKKEVDFSGYLVLFWRYKFLIIFSLIFFSSIGYTFYKYEVPSYSATANLEIGSEIVGTTFDIGNVQKTDALITLARSYYFISQVVNDLNLTQYPIKLSLIEQAMTKEATKTLDLRETILYYRNNVDIRAKRGGILSVTATTQYPELSAAIANKIGDLAIDERVKTKNERIQKTIEYIDGQLKPLKQLLVQNRRDKEDNEASANYNEIMELQDRILTDQNTLTVLRREQEHLRASLILTNESDERVKFEARQNYVQFRIEELLDSIEQGKTRLRQIDKTELYNVKDLEFSIGTNEEIYKSLISEKQRIVLASLIEARDIRFLGKAYVPIYPDKMRGILLILMFSGVGLAFAFGLIQLFELLNRRFKSSQEVEERLDLKVIGNIPIISKKEKFDLIDPKAHPKSFITESYRTLATNIKFGTKRKNIKSITFTSDKPQTGKSYTIANLGIIMSDSANKVLVMDVDLRNPSLHTIFKMKRKPGLTDVLSKSAELKDVLIKIKHNLYLLPAGSLSFNPQSVLESDAMRETMSRLSKEFDFILCDSIPVTTFSDVAILASLTDASIIVIDMKSDKKAVDTSKRRMEEVNSNILGIIINRAKKRYMKYHYKYYRYGKYERK